jgi:hypothetical protein
MATFVGDLLTKETFSETKELSFPYSTQHIIIKPHPDISQNSGTQIRFFGRNLYIKSEDSHTQIFGVPVFDYTFTENTDSIVTICVSKNFKDNTDVFQNNIKAEDSIIYIPSLFYLEKDYWSGERIRVEISVPKGVHLTIEKPFVRGKSIKKQGSLSPLPRYTYCESLY